MAIGKIARDTGFVPQWDFAAAAREWLAARPGNLPDRLLQSSNDTQAAEELFLGALSRLPRP